MTTDTARGDALNNRGGRMSTPIPDDFVRVLAAHHDRNIARLAAELRDLADRVERHGKPHDSVADTLPDYTKAASRVAHDVTSTLTQARLDTLVADAAKASAAVRGVVLP